MIMWPTIFIIFIYKLYFYLSALHHFSGLGSNDDGQFFQSSNFYGLQDREPQISDAQTRSGILR